MIKNIIMTLFIIIIFIIFIPNNINIVKIYLRDIVHVLNHFFRYKIKYNNNINTNNNNYKNIKVLIISFDNRSESELKYLKFHKENISKYCKQWKNIDYFFTNKCNKNIYWCKLYLIQEKLKSSKYDYIQVIFLLAIIKVLIKKKKIIFYVQEYLLLKIQKLGKNL
jgi:Ca2+/Na+ antiporter